MGATRAGRHARPRQTAAAPLRPGVPRVRPGPRRIDETIDAHRATGSVPGCSPALRDVQVVAPRPLRAGGHTRRDHDRAPPCSGAHPIGSPPVPPVASGPPRAPDAHEQSVESPLSASNTRRRKANTKDEIRDRHRGACGTTRSTIRITVASLYLLISKACWSAIERTTIGTRLLTFYYASTRPSNRATSVHYGLLFNTCAQALRTPKHEGRNRNLHRPLIMRQTTAQRETEFKQTTDNARPGIRNKR